MVQSCHRRDTTFSSHLNELGRDLAGMIRANVSESSTVSDIESLKIFTIPLVAGSKAIALITLGFPELDAFSQAKLSYLYSIREHLAQLVWNLILQEQVSHQSQHDYVTGLITYSYFQRVYEAAIHATMIHNRPTAVMLVEINNMTAINTASGHSSGDDALRQLTALIRQRVRPVDTLARYGGDELVLLLPDFAVDETYDLAIELKEAAEQVRINNEHTLSISIGYAVHPDHATRGDALLRCAEKALHVAKYNSDKTGESYHCGHHHVAKMSEQDLIEVMVARTARKYDTSCTNAFQSLVHQLEQLKQAAATSSETMMLETISSLAGALEAKDRYTQGHSYAVANYAVVLARALDLPEDEVQQIRMAAFLHDIGKIGIPEAILCKEGPLTEEERLIMNEHPTIGARQILAPVSSLKPLLPMVEHHHENWDGTGYPAGLAGEDIPLGARIVSIVDVYHALTSDRSYRKALSIQEAKDIMDAGSGKKWDPHLVARFFDIVMKASRQAAKPVVQEELLEESAVIADNVVSIASAVRQPATL
jgi:diguanylate cyclase (GGDEF)-like protein